VLRHKENKTRKTRDSGEVRKGRKPLPPGVARIVNKGVRLSSKEHRLIRSACKLVDQSVVEFIRIAAVEKAQAVKETA
jgi:hypothetical protein